MSEEERKRLCAKLRREYYDGEWAAGEIERLAKRVAELEKELAYMETDFFIPPSPSPEITHE